ARPPAQRFEAHGSTSGESVEDPGSGHGVSENAEECLSSSIGSGPDVAAGRHCDPAALELAGDDAQPALQPHEPFARDRVAPSRSDRSASGCLAAARVAGTTPAFGLPRPACGARGARGGAPWPAATGLGARSTRASRVRVARTLLVGEALELDPLHGAAEQALDVAHAALVELADQRHGLPQTLRAAGPTDAVDVLLRVHRHVEVDDE